MRRPTLPDEAYAWHRETLAGNRPPVHGDDPQCGWFRRRMVKDGPWVPAAIWWKQEICPVNGDLLSPEILLCTVNERDCDPYREWAWLASNPISEADFNEMIERKDWAGSNDPTNPVLNPEQPVDLARRPVLPPKPVTGGLFDA